MDLKLTHDTKLNGIAGSGAFDVGGGARIFAGLGP